MMAQSFQAQVSAWARKSENRMEAVLKESVQELVTQVQTPTAKGGRMRVDTGFLINSGSAALNSIPKGQSQKPEDYSQQSWDASPTVLVINRARIGDRIAFGWTADYARYRESKDAFLRSAVQNWRQIVAGAAFRIEREVKS